MSPHHPEPEPELSPEPGPVPRAARLGLPFGPPGGVPTGSDGAGAESGWPGRVADKVPPRAVGR